METTKQRKKLFEFFQNYIYDSYDILDVKNTDWVYLAEGVQGKVYRYCESKSKCLVIKESFINKKEASYIYKPYDKKAFKLDDGYFIENACGQLNNQLVLQNICPHLVLNYGYDGMDNNKKKNPYSLLLYNEFISDSQTYYDWAHEKQYKEEIYYNIYFQILYTLLALQAHFNIKHLDLHEQNILIQKTKKTKGCFEYIIGEQSYYVPDCGYRAFIIDFGRADIPKHFSTWLSKEYYKDKKINEIFDIIHLFDTKRLGKTPKAVYKNLRDFLRILKISFTFHDFIFDVFMPFYNKKLNSVIEKYEVFKVINIKKIPSKLKYLVSNKKRLLEYSEGDLTFLLEK